MAEDENLYSSTLLPPVTIIIDLCHYLLCGKQPKWGTVLNGNANAAAIVEAMPNVMVEPRPIKKSRRSSTKQTCTVNLIEPSLLKAIRDLCTERSHTDVLPLFSAHVPFRRKIVDQTFGEAVNSLDASATIEFSPKLEFASVEHDSRMLRWGNRSLSNPDITLHKCIFDDDKSCKAFQLRATNGALDSYCTPSQYALFDSSGIIPPRGPCLLCIRDMVTSIVAAQMNTLLDPRRCQHRHSPPTYNTVNQPGGYNDVFVLQPSAYPILTAPFVRGDLTQISVCRTQEIDPTFSGIYADQGKMIFQGGPNE